MQYSHFEQILNLKLITVNIFFKNYFLKIQQFYNFKLKTSKKIELFIIRGFKFWWKKFPIKSLKKRIKSRIKLKILQFKLKVPENEAFLIQNFKNWINKQL